MQGAFMWKGKAFPFFLVSLFLCVAPIFQAFAQPIPVDPAVQAQIDLLGKAVARNGHSFSVGYSDAMDKTIDELCGLKEPSNWEKSAPVMAPMLFAVALPSSLDWRALGADVPIRNQGSCGGCWAFGTLAPLEAQIKLQCGVTADLSEQYLASCNIDGWGCNGGWWAHDYQLDKSGQDNSGPGAVLENGFPYKDSETPCGGPYRHTYTISNWGYLADDGAVPSVRTLKEAIYAYGPISAAVYVGPLFQAYKEGIFDADEQGQVNHAITLVGWVDEAGPDNGYWILRNSWGTSWGENGYMRIRYANNQVGYAANFVQFACPAGALTPGTHSN